MNTRTNGAAHHSKAASSNGASGEPARPVGIWIRVSTEDQARGESPENHEARARMYAELKGWPVARVYDLSGVSGKSVMNHPECRAMLADVEAGRIGGLIFSKLARLARNTRELLDFAEYFRTHGADLISLGESIDTSTPAGRFFYTLIAAMAQWEREEIAERTRASVAVRARLGKSIGGMAPYGYRWEDGRLVLEPNEAPVRRLMFEVFREERRVRTTARRLNEAGYRTRTGALFSGTTVKRLLTDPAAKGTRRVNYRDHGSAGAPSAYKPSSEWIDVEVPALVSEQLWEEVNALLAEQAAPPRRPARKAVQLFGGLTYCRPCERKMYKPKRMAKYYCEHCHTKMPVDDLERVFVEQLRGFLLNPDEVAAHVEQNDRVLAEKRSLLAAAEAERLSVERDRAKVYRAYLDDELSTDAFGTLFRPLDARLNALGEEIPRLQAEIDIIAINNLSAAEVAASAGTLYERWPDLTFEEKRAVVETLMERVTIGDGEVEFSLAYVPAVPQNPNGFSPPENPPPGPHSPTSVTKKLQSPAASWRA